MAVSTRLSGRLAMIEQRLKAEAPLSGNRLSVHPTRDFFERQAAARLVGRMYLREGYLDKKSDIRGLRSGNRHIEFHHLLGESQVFIAKKGQQLCGTASAILDSPAGLPLEALYQDTVQTYRRKNLRLGEVCSLAIDSDRREDMATVLGLVSAMFRFFYTQSDREIVLITLKPSHKRFYERLGFRCCGPMRLDLRFQNVETIVMSINREQAKAVMNSFNLGTEEETFRPVPTHGPDPVEILEWCLKHSELLANATARQRRYLLRSLHQHSECVRMPVDSVEV